MQTELEAPQDGGSAQKDLLEAIEIGDPPSLPSFSQSMIHDAQVVETCHGEGVYGVYFIKVEDVTGPSDLEAPKKSSSEVGAPCLFYEAQRALNRASSYFLCQFSYLCFSFLV